MVEGIAFIDAVPRTYHAGEKITFTLEGRAACGLPESPHPPERFSTKMGHTIAAGSPMRDNDYLMGEHERSSLVSIGPNRR